MTQYHTPDKTLSTTRSTKVGPPLEVTFDLRAKKLPKLIVYKNSKCTVWKLYFVEKYQQKRSRDLVTFHYCLEYR